MRTPERAVWPLPPRPPVLPLPEPMPRPTRMRVLRAPGLSRSWSSFIVLNLQSPLSGLVRRLDLQHMGDLVDHAADRGRVLDHVRAVHLVETERLQRVALAGLAADRAAGLGDLELGHCTSPYSRASAAASPRLPRMSLTFLERRAATERGELQCWSASNAALIMLCGFEVPTDLATTSCTPNASKIARTGPPAMMPVPGTAARITTRPAPKWPSESWCRVRPSRSGTRIIVRLACSVALRIASGTSRALPEP